VDNGGIIEGRRRLQGIIVNGKVEVERMARVDWKTATTRWRPPTG